MLEKTVSRMELIVISFVILIIGVIGFVIVTDRLDDQAEASTNEQMSTLQDRVLALEVRLEQPNQLNLINQRAIIALETQVAQLKEDQAQFLEFMEATKSMKASGTSFEDDFLLDQFGLMPEDESASLIFLMMLLGSLLADDDYAGAFPSWSTQPIPPPDCYIGEFGCEDDSPSFYEDDFFEEDLPDEICIGEDSSTIVDC